MLAGDVLGLGGVEELEVGPGDFGGAVFLRVFLNDRDRRLGQDADATG